MRFFDAETTFGYFHVMKLYIERYGKPIALYSDKFGVFKVNTPEPVTGTGRTQFGRAMKDLEIELIFAHSPQAKGRVERANGTLQDRLIKELRLRAISDIETANKFLDEYAEHLNSKFAVLPKDPTNVHRTLKDLKSLEIHFTHQEERGVDKNLTVRYKGKMYAINMPGKGHRLRQAKVTVCEAESGKITLHHKGQSLNYKVYDKKQHYSESITSKELDARFQGLNKHPVVKHNSHHKPAANHPWKKQQRARYRLKELKKQGLVPNKHLKLVSNLEVSPQVAGGWGDRSDRRR